MRGDGARVLGFPGAERAGDVRNDPRVPHTGDKEEEEPAEQPQRGHSLRLPAHCRGLPPSFPPPRTDVGIWALRAPKDEASKVDFLAASQPCIRRCPWRPDTHRSPRVGYVSIAFSARIGAEAGSSAGNWSGCAILLEGVLILGLSEESFGNLRCLHNGGSRLRCDVPLSTFVLAGSALNRNASCLNPGPETLNPEV